MPGEGYPWPWTIAPWIEGRTVADVPPPDRSGIAVPLADFMTGLHRPAPPDAPPRGRRRGDLGARTGLGPRHRHCSGRLLGR
ncbi:phosphotransferase [Nonomuraea sp. GTA35]|uniref:phosphotransferase n=1 Tax=Nonomuraea sp. GTA35 TaxID=1676746 RepID=UPI0035C1E187